MQRILRHEVGVVNGTIHWINQGTNVDENLVNGLHRGFRHVREVVDDLGCNFWVKIDKRSVMDFLVVMDLGVGSILGFKSK